MLSIPIGVQMRMSLPACQSWPSLGRILPCTVIVAWMIVPSDHTASLEARFSDLVAPWLLKDRGDWNVATPGAPVEPGGPNVTAAPAETSVAEPPAETLE
jgi:hypothetical protein